MGKLESYDTFYFPFFGISWILPFLVKDLFMGSNGSLFGQEEKEGLENRSSLLFFEQFARNETEESLKGSKALSNILRTPSLLIE